MRRETLSDPGLCIWKQLGSLGRGSAARPGEDPRPVSRPQGLMCEGQGLSSRPHLQTVRGNAGLSVTDRGLEVGEGTLHGT